MGSKEIEYLPLEVIQIFRLDISQVALKNAEQAGKIPEAIRRKRGTREYRYWPTSSLPQVGAHFGKLNKPQHCQIIATYVPKGGTGKTAWTFNFSRILALHGLKVLAIGTDFQCSLSKSFGAEYDTEQVPLSIYDCIVEGVPLSDVIASTDIPTLDFVPESDELSMLDRQILSRPRREYILESILAPIKKDYDAIIIDCPPQWMEIVSNALWVADSLVAPVLADGESFHSFKKFMRELKKFTEIMGKDYSYVKFIPNLVDVRNKYTSSFQQKYISEYPEMFTTSYLRDSVALKESGTALRSILEYEASSSIANDVYDTVCEIWAGILAAEQESLA